jgi:hypothetical protein
VDEHRQGQILGQRQDRAERLVGDAQPGEGRVDLDTRQVRAVGAHEGQIGRAGLDPGQEPERPGEGRGAEDPLDRLEQGRVLAAVRRHERRTVDARGGEHRQRAREIVLTAEEVGVAPGSDVDVGVDDQDGRPGATPGCGR